MEGIVMSKPFDLDELQDTARDWNEDYLRGLETAKFNDTACGDQKKPTQAKILIDIATGDDVDLYHSRDGTTYADIMVEGHRETWPTRSQGFRRWLRRAYYVKTGGAPNGEAVAAALALIEARAQFDGMTREVCVRVAAHGGLIYIDLGDETWQAIEIDADGWRIRKTPPARFRRTQGMLRLTISRAYRPTSLTRSAD
jgi:hypothetical protein